MNMCLIWGLQYLIMDTPTHPPKKRRIIVMGLSSSDEDGQIC